jgi:hypothetical protein
MEAFLQNLQAGGGQENKPRCRCGLVAVEAKSIKHNGRAYWRCGKQKGCDYFKWDDELNTNHPAGSWSGGQPAQQGSTSFQAGQVCYKCHQVRWRSRVVGVATGECDVVW